MKYPPHILGGVMVMVFFLIIECIIQTKLLGKCHYLCGRFCGLTAGAVLWNENVKDITIFE